MKKRKVTLSLDDKVYSDFQRYCDENAVMLSKRIELFMKAILKNKKLNLFFMIFFGLFLINAVSVSAADIFFDGFESGGLSGWTLTHAAGANDWTASTTAPYSGTYHAFGRPIDTDDPGCTMEKITATSGYENINFSYYRKLNLGTASHIFRAKWFDGSTWNIVEEITGSVSDPSYVSKSFLLSSQASNNPSFSIKFECTEGTTTKDCNLDNVNITGTPIDTNPPTFSNYVENPVNNSDYSPGQLYEFNVSITESNLEVVWIEWEGSNYTNGNLINISDVYTFNRTDLSAGTYSYKWWANDTNGNINSSEVLYYTVSKAAQTASLNINETSPITYGNYINATCNGELFRDNVNVTLEIGNSILLGAGSYNYSCKLYEIENYSYDDDNSTFVVDRADVSLTLTSDNGWTVDYLQGTYVNCSSSQGTASLALESIPVANPYFANLSAGDFTFNCSYSETQNYSANSAVDILTVSKIQMPISLYIDGIESDKEAVYETQTNVTGTKQYLEGSLALLRDGNSIGNPEIAILGAGYYNYTLNYAETQNFTSNTKTFFLNITKATPVISLLLNGNSNNIELTYLQNLNASASSSGGTVHLYRENINIDSENAQNKILGAGYYEYGANATGNENYTDNSEAIALYVNISKADPSGDMQIIITPSNNESYGVQTSTSASETNTGDGDLSYGLFKDSVITSNPSLGRFSAGVYVYEYNTTGGQNYTSGSRNETLTINQIASNVSLYLNNSRANIEVVQGTSIAINSTLQAGEGEVYVYQESEILYQGSAPSYNLTGFQDVGFFNITAIYEQTQNYTFSSETFWINVSEAPDIYPPVIDLVSPQDGAPYGDNESLSLDFSVTDAHLDSCWYNIDDGTNITLADCENTTFNVSGNGNYILSLYANDTLGNEANRSASFNVQIGAPTIELHFPIDAYLNYNEVQFNYTPNDTNLDSCELWGNFDGEFKLNQTDSSPANGLENTFSLTLPDGTYLWTIGCNDSQGNYASDGNKTFYVDMISPTVSLYEPVGANPSQTLVASWSVGDASPMTCIYNVYRGASPEIENTTINCSDNSTSFIVSSDGAFVFNFFVNDSAGNENSTSSSFSVDTSVPPVVPPSGGGGGGGGTRVNATILGLGKVQITQLPNLIVDPGESKKIVLSVQNIGKGFLNDCRIKGIGNNSNWISSSEVKGLSIGEKHDFTFMLNVPEKIGAGSYELNISVICQETNQSTSFIAEIIEKKLGVELITIEREADDKVRIDYSLEELSGVSQDVAVEIVLLNQNNERLAEISENRTIVPDSEQQFSAYLTVPASLAGNFNLLINAISKTSSAFVQEGVILGKPKGTGLAILDIASMDTLLTVFLIVLFAALAIFVVWRIIKLKKDGKVMKLEKISKPKKVIIKKRSRR